MFELVKGDLDPDMELTVTVNGVAQDLTAATTIKLRWLKPDGTTADVTLTAVNLLAGKVKRVWVVGDTNLVGYHKGRIVITWANGETQTFPNDGSWHIWAVHKSD